MKELTFTVEIYATKDKVWNTLWQDKTFREWAGLIDPGTYMVGELNEGSEVQFISAENGYGVTSFIESVIENEYLLLRHSSDTQEIGTLKRETQWTGGKEEYSLTRENGFTRLSLVFDTPVELEDELSVSYPKALQRVKELAEAA